MSLFHLNSWRIFHWDLNSELPFKIYFSLLRFPIFLFISGVFSFMSLGIVIIAALTSLSVNSNIWNGIDLFCLSYLLWWVMFWRFLLYKAILDCILDMVNDKLQILRILCSSEEYWLFLKATWLNTNYKFCLPWGVKQLVQLCSW